MIYYYALTSVIRNDFVAPLRSLMWFDNNCFVNAALHAAAGLGLHRRFVQRGFQESEDSMNGYEYDDEEGGQ